MKIKKDPEIDSTENIEVEEEKGIALNSFIAKAGICSRRAAVELIKKGHITVNHYIIDEPGFKVLPKDTVRYKDRPVKEQKKVYILLNKPKGYVTTVEDERGRKTVMDLVKKASKERIFPVGRLDRDTTGLLILTNDGDLSQKMAHPKNKVTKIYYVVLDKLVQHEDLLKLKQGVYLEDGKAYADRVNFPKGKPRNHVIIEIHGGKNRIIKRMFSHLGYKVVGLDRIAYGGLTKKGSIVGHWRPLTDEEVQDLYNS